MAALDSRILESAFPEYTSVDSLDVGSGTDLSSGSFRPNNGSDDGGTLLNASFPAFHDGNNNGSSLLIPIEFRFDNVPPLDSAVFVTVVYVTIFITGVVGNICTCHVIARNRYMATATNYYLFSLAVSDLLLLILGLPQEIYLIWYPSPFVFGETFCVFRGIAAETSTNASILTITAFTVERYVAICHSLKAHTMSKLSRAIKLILVIWVIAAICSVPTAIQFGIVYQYYGVEPIPNSSECLVKNRLELAFELSTLFFFCLPMTLISVLYLLIAARLRRSSISDREEGGKVKSQSPRACRHQNGSSSRKAVIKMLGVQSHLLQVSTRLSVAVVVAFFVCWAPFHAQRLMAIYASAESQLAVNIYEALTYVSGVLYYVSATINPILYHIMSLKFRAAFKDTLSSCCCLAAAAAAQRRRRRSMGRHFPSRCQSKSINNSMSYYFNSTIRSRTQIVNDNTDTTLELMLDDNNATNAAATANKCVGAQPDPETPVVVSTDSPPVVTFNEKDLIHERRNNRKSDSISNSSMQMMDEEDASNPLELSNFMAELNELYDAGSGAKSKFLASTPAVEQSNGNGYCVSHC